MQCLNNPDLSKEENSVLFEPWNGNVLVFHMFRRFPAVPFVPLVVDGGLHEVGDRDV